MSEAEAFRRALLNLADAVENGTPVDPVICGITPANQEDAEELAGGVLAQLGFQPCGVRQVPAADGSLIAGPMLEARFLDDGAGLSLEIMRHGRASAALLGVLGAALEPDATTPPEISVLHPALDVSASRFTEGPKDRFAEIADLAGLGLLVLGKPRPVPDGPVRVALIEGEGRPKGKAFDVQAAFAGVAAEARRLGGLPAGAVLVVAGLGAPVVRLQAGMRLTARFTGIGKVSARCG